MAVYSLFGTKIVAPITFESEELIYENETLSLKREFLKGTAQRWKLSFNLAPTTNAPYTWRSVLNSTAPFNMTMPQINVVNYPNGLGSLIRLKQNNLDAAGQKVVRIAASTNVSIPVNRFVTFGNHSKVYIVTKAYTANSGDNTIEVFPNLVQSLPGLTEVMFGDDVILRGRLSNDSLKGITFTDGVLADPGQITVIEDLI